MFNHRFDEKVSPTVIFHWFLLSFSGGAINAGGFLATGRFVSHVTGFATIFGVDISSHQLKAAFGILSVPLFFLLGAFIAGFLIDRPIFKGQKPRFDWVMGLSSLCLFISAGGGELLSFLYGSQFGEALGLKQSYVLLVLLCLASGLQNAAITSSSGRSIRVTHLTGLTTDLGLGLARIFTLSQKNKTTDDDWRANYLRIGSIISFIIGSAIGAWFFLKLGYLGFLIPALIAAYAAWHGHKAKTIWFSDRDNREILVQ